MITAKFITGLNTCRKHVIFKALIESPRPLSVGELEVKTGLEAQPIRAYLVRMKRLGYVVNNRPFHEISAQTKKVLAVHDLAGVAEIARFFEDQNIYNILEFCRDGKTKSEIKAKGKYWRQCWYYAKRAEKEGYMQLYGNTFISTGQFQNDKARFFAQFK